MRHRILVIACTALAAGALLASSSVSCGGTAEPQASEADAAVETGIADARDPTRNPTDASTDGGASTDGAVPLPGAFLKIPGLPDSCGARVAKDPTVSIPRLPWRACTSGRAGCLQFAANWYDAHPAYLLTTSHFAQPYEDASGVHLAYWYRTRGANAASFGVSIVQALHGDAELVILGTAGTDQCDALKIGASASGYGATIVQLNSSDAAPIPYGIWAAWSPRAEPGKLSVHSLTELLQPFPIVQGMAQGDGFMTFEQTAGGGIYSSAFRLSDRTLVKPRTPLVGNEVPLPVVGGYIAFVTDTVPPSVGFMPLEGGYRTVIRPLAGQDFTSLATDRANGDALVWAETNPTTTVTTLYTAPFATTEATLVRRPVAKLPFFQGGVVNAGLLAYPLAHDTIRIVRLSDGLAWEIPAEADGPAMSAIWVNQEYVWLTVSAVPFGQPGFPLTGGLARLPIPKTAPSIPSGL